jgi:transposase
VLSRRAVTVAKTGDGPIEMLRLFRLARAPAGKARTQAINQLNAVIVGADPRLRDTLTGLAGAALIRHCVNLPSVAPIDVAAAACHTLRRLAQRIQALTTEQRELQRRIIVVLRTHAPQLLQRHGIGPDSAAALLVTAGDNPDRLHSEASFAALCGVSPIEASSGKTRRRRLNRGGDRRANAALHRIALTRARGDQPTRDYLDHRTAQGRTRREAIRCIKRYTPRDLPANPTARPRTNLANGLTSIGHQCLPDSLWRWAPDALCVCQRGPALVASCGRDWRGSARV